MKVTITDKCFFCRKNFEVRDQHVIAIADQEHLIMGELNVKKYRSCDECWSKVKKGTINFIENLREEI